MCVRVHTESQALISVCINQTLEQELSSETSSQNVFSTELAGNPLTRTQLPDFDFVFVYWHLILVTPDGPRFRSTFLPRLPLAVVVLF